MSTETFVLSGREVYLCPVCSTPANGVCVPVAERDEHEGRHREVDDVCPACLAPLSVAQDAEFCPAAEHHHSETVRP